MKISRLIITFHYLPGIVTKDDDLACRELHKDLLLKQLARVLLNTFEAKN
jgi:hypothetical protein